MFYYILLLLLSSLDLELFVYESIIKRPKWHGESGFFP